MNFYTLTIYNGKIKIYVGIFSTYISARDFAIGRAHRDLVFQPSPEVQAQWKDETETYYIDCVPEGYNIK